MTRLRPPPSRLPPRVLVLCFMIALAMLWRAGGTTEESWRLAVALLPLDPGGAATLRVLLGKMVASFFLISFSLGTGLILALALALLASRLGGRASRFAGWLGRILTCVPPMGWALGAMVWLIKVRGLPVERLFPYRPPAESDTTSLRIGRELWSWIVPVLVLAVPVLGTALFSLTHKLSSLLRDPAVDRLKARGLLRAQILYRHLVPLLRVHLARLARPIAALLLAFDIPVEQLLGFDGWGRFAAARLSSTASPGHALASVFWTGGLILTGILGWLSLLDRQGLPREAEQDADPAQRRSIRSAVCGVGLALLLMLPLRWFLPETIIRGGAGSAQLAWTSEITRALGVSLAALAFLGASSFLMSLLRPRHFGRGWAAALAVTPLLVALLFLEKECGRRWWAIALVVAIPAIAAFAEVFRDADDSDFIEASRAMGQSRRGVWLRHLLPGVLQSLPGLALRNTATALMIFCVLDFYGATSAGTWGGLMRRHADHVLDDPIPALAPALLLTLWGLSFRLLSRASRDGPPSGRTTPFDR